MCSKVHGHTYTLTHTTSTLISKPIFMKKNKLPIVGKVQDINDEFNKAFRDEVFMPMVTFAGTLLVFTVLLDYTFQFIDAIDWLTL